MKHKHYLKKLSALFLSAAMLLSVLSLTALAADQPCIVIGDGSVELSGEEGNVTVPVSISGNTGFAAMKLSIDLPDGVTVANVSTARGGEYAVTALVGMLLQHSLTYPAYSTGNSMVMAMASAQDASEDGVLFWITFTVSPAAAAGSHPLTVECSEFYSVSDLDTNHYADVATQSGTLTITKSSSSNSGSSSSGSTNTGSNPGGGTEEPVGFTDVVPGAYYEDAVTWAVDLGITAGTSATTFSPDVVCTRAQAVTFLWRMVGCPDPVISENRFNDVAVGDYYYDAVLWAVEQGITAGTSDSTFSPGATCSRAQIVTFLYRLAVEPEVIGASFADVDPGAYYAAAVMWAVAMGITTGTGNDTFSPDSDCTRGQIVTFLYRAAA